MALLTNQIMHLYIVLLTFVVLAQAVEKIPSQDDIEDYDDPVLREVFASSRNKQPNAGQIRPHEIKIAPVPNQTQRPYSGGYSATQQPYSYGNVQSAYRPTYTNQPSLSSNYNSPSSDLGNLAAQGAQTFAQGAQQLGRVFGIENSAYNSGGYEFPLAGGFFGK